jgi:hypothetical protein
MPQDLLVFLGRIGHFRQGLLRYDQRVQWRLRIDVIKSDADIVLVNDVCRDLAFDYLCK